MNIEQVETIGHVTTLNGLPGMSSKEIAEITGKKHGHVLRDIRKMLEALGLADQSKSGSVQYAETRYRDAKSQSQPLTILDKELTFTLLSRYSFELSNLIVKRWLELEGAGFIRVSVQGAVAHLIEREKDNRGAAFKAMGRGRSLSPAQKERRKLDRRVNAEANRQRKAGRDWH
jgi:phage regulator Rha-like protein